MGLMSKKIEQILYEEDIDKIKIVKSIDNPKELYELISHYNYDDGYKLPMAILQHPLCELAHAIHLYWISDSDMWYDEEEYEDEIEKEHYEFSKFLEKRILEGFYKAKSLNHKGNFNRIDIFNFKKVSFPEVFYMPVEVKNVL